MKRISYDHPRYDEIKREAERLVNREFSFIPLDMVEKYADGQLFEHIEPLAFSEMLENYHVREYFEEFAEEQTDDETEQTSIVAELSENWQENPEFLEWLEDEHGDEIRENFESDYPDHNYPMWGTVFVANNKWMSERIESNPEAAQACGFGIINGFKNMNAGLFVSGAGYDFYESHWIPFFTTFVNWIKVEETEQAE